MPGQTSRRNRTNNYRRNSQRSRKPRGNTSENLTPFEVLKKRYENCDHLYKKNSYNTCKKNAKRLFDDFRGLHRPNYMWAAKCQHLVASCYMKRAELVRSPDEKLKYLCKALDASLEGCRLTTRKGHGRNHHAHIKQYNNVIYQLKNLLRAGNFNSEKYLVSFNSVIHLANERFLNTNGRENLGIIYFTKFQILAVKLKRDFPNLNTPEKILTHLDSIREAIRTFQLARYFGCNYEYRFNEFLNGKRNGLDRLGKIAFKNDFKEALPEILSLKISITNQMGLRASLNDYYQASIAYKNKVNEIDLNEIIKADEEIKDKVLTQALDDCNRAVDYVERTWKEAPDDDKYAIHLGYCQLKMADLLKAKGKPKAALHRYELALQVAINRGKFKELEYLSHRNLAYVNLNMANANTVKAEKRQQLCKQALKHATQCKNMVDAPSLDLQNKKIEVTQLTYAVFIDYASYLAYPKENLSYRNYQQAISLLKKALTLSNTMQDSKERAITCHNKLASIHFKKNQYNLAIKHFEACLQNKEELDGGLEAEDSERHMLAVCFEELAEKHNYKKEHEDAYNAFKRAYDIFHENNNLRNCARVSYKMANLCRVTSKKNTLIFSHIKNAVFLNIKTLMEQYRNNESLIEDLSKKQKEMQECIRENIAIKDKIATLFRIEEELHDLRKKLNIKQTSPQSPRYSNDTNTSPANTSSESNERDKGKEKEIDLPATSHKRKRRNERSPSNHSSNSKEPITKRRKPDLQSRRSIPSSSRKTTAENLRGTSRTERIPRRVDPSDRRSTRRSSRHYKSAVSSRNNNSRTHITSNHSFWNGTSQPRSPKPFSRRDSRNSRRDPRNSRRDPRNFRRGSRNSIQHR